MLTRTGDAERSGPRKEGHAGPGYERYREAPQRSSAGSSKAAGPFDFTIFLLWFWF